MNRSKLYQDMDILFFDINKTKHRRSGSFLKSFIQFLQFSGEKAPLKFSFVSKRPSLVENLSIKENILLDSLQNSLADSKEDLLTKYIDNSGNEALIKLFHSVGDLSKLPCSLNDESRKIIGIIKAIIQGSPYILMEEPEQFLTAETKKLVEQAIIFESKKKSHNFLIASGKYQLWQEIVNKSVYKLENGGFEIKTIYKDENKKIIDLNTSDSINFVIPDKNKTAA